MLFAGWQVGPVKNPAAIPTGSPGEPGHSLNNPGK